MGLQMGKFPHITFASYVTANLFFSSSNFSHAALVRMVGCCTDIVHMHALADTCYLLATLHQIDHELEDTLVPCSSFSLFTSVVVIQNISPIYFFSYLNFLCSTMPFGNIHIKLQ